MFAKSKIIVSLSVIFLFLNIGAATVNFSDEFTLSDSISAIDSNYHPEGLAFDKENNKFVYAIQGTSSLKITDINGDNLEEYSPTRSNTYSRSEYLGGVAVTDSRYYYSEYGSNNGDLRYWDKSGNSEDGVKIDGGWYGSTPIAASSNNEFIWVSEQKCGSYDWSCKTSMSKWYLNGTATGERIDFGVSIDDAEFLSNRILVLEWTSRNDYGEDADVLLYDYSGENLENYTVTSPGSDYKPAGIASTENSNFYIYFQAQSGNSLVRKYNINLNVENFCDFRGPLNECVMNETNQLGQQQYNISSVFEARSSAVFESTNGQSTLNITNTTTISGFWEGSFSINTESPRLVSGTRFKPEGGRIIVGE